MLTIGQWQEIVEELDELADIRAYDEAKSHPQRGGCRGRGIPEGRYQVGPIPSSK